MAGGMSDGSGAATTAGGVGDGSDAGGGNSNCVDDIKGGYRCKCSHGYEGNPYIKDGCKDINECLDNATYPCMGICKNTIGSFDCSCYPGSYMKNGFCLPNQKSTFPARHVIGASVGFVILVIAITFACYVQQRRKLQHIKNNYFQQHGGLILFEEMKSQQGHAFKIFSEEELQQATKKFNEQEILGQGGNGIVYKGLLKSNSEVAVKKCMTIDEQKKKEFGPMLVYEFIPNGTLFHLIHENHGNHISLITRLRIAHESAEALAYLHSCASPPILHGDVKSSNILLDNNFSAKVSDFGASILAPTDEMQFVTLVQGTCGYLDPEYMQTCQLTDKSDENKLEDMLNDQIKNNENMEFLEEMAELARKCLDMSSINRPSMKEIGDELGRLRKVMEHQCARQNPEEMESFLGDSSYVINSTVESTKSFSIEKNAMKRLKSGR
ncbi:Os09g0373800 [Oryza sativa Japonica Group]|uniref:Os09g0373800 protein n=1 Tax=Oryza sativa subsp. japonica TaxID=39947 RepID=C7J6F5_ORYSJ|nr:Os09g0373800 [Oryza sativa Japonica Group]|eukprot:NP_001175807.1 Os09g0373800 [Oryza sativa Japonica Group]